MSRIPSLIFQLSDEEFITLIKTSNSYADCLRKLGLVPSGGRPLHNIKRRIKSLKLNVSFNSKTRRKSCKQDLSEILVENSTYQNNSSLKRRIVNEGYLDYYCSICKITSWNDRPITLQLDHINGINTDNRIDNLRFLCPNCHSQTETYAGKNKFKCP